MLRVWWARPLWAAFLERWHCRSFCECECVQRTPDFDGARKMLWKLLKYMKSARNNLSKGIFHAVEENFLVLFHSWSWWVWRKCWRQHQELQRCSSREMWNCFDDSGVAHVVNCVGSTGGKLWEGLKSWRSKSSEKAFSKVFNFPIRFHSISHANFPLGPSARILFMVNRRAKLDRLSSYIFYFCSSFFDSARIIYFWERSEGHTTTGCVCGTREVKQSICLVLKT